MKRFFAIALLSLLLALPAHATSSVSSIWFTVGQKYIITSLDYSNLGEPGYQNVTVSVKNQLMIGMKNVSISAVLTKPDGTQETITFVDKQNGNYTKNISFSQMGRYRLDVNATATGYENLFASVYGYIDIGYLDITDFDIFGEETIYQTRGIVFYTSVKKLTPMTYTIIREDIEITRSGTMADISSFSIILNSNINETMAIHKTWTASVAPGAYRARVVIYYHDNSNKEKSLSSDYVNFTVLQLDTYQSGGGGSHGGSSGSSSTTGSNNIIGSNTAIAQTSHQNEIIHFTDMPSLIEVQHGSSLVDSISFLNPTGADINNIKVQVEGVPQNWIHVPSAFDLAAGKEQMSDIYFDIPPDAAPGDYNVKFSFINDVNIREYNTILKVKPVDEKEHVMVVKKASVDEEKGQTHFSIVAQNKENYVKSVEIVENIDKSIAGNVRELSFDVPPSEIIQADPVVKWILKDMKPEQRIDLRYSVNKTVTNLTPFLVSSVQLVSIIDRAPEDAIVVKGVTRPLLEPNQTASIDVLLLNNAQYDIGVNATLKTDGISRILPEYINVTVPAGSPITLKFLMVPKKPGHETLALTLDYAGYRKEQEMTVYVFRYLLLDLFILNMVLIALVIYAVRYTKKKAEKKEELEEAKEMMGRKLKVGEE